MVSASMVTDLTSSYGTFSNNMRSFCASPKSGYMVQASLKGLQSKLRKHTSQPCDRYHERANAHTNITARLSRNAGWALVEQAVCVSCGVGGKQGGICRAWRGGGCGSKAIWVVARLRRLLGGHHVAAVKRFGMGILTSVGDQRGCGYWEGVVGATITVGVERVAWSVPSVAIVGVLAGTGVPRVS